MTTKRNVVAQDAVQNETKKVLRRGVASARGTARLKFSHELANRNGLFTGHLDSVTTSMIAIGEDKTGMPSFNGLEIPKIVFTFASNEPEVNKRHYVTLQFTAVESNVETIPGGKEDWKVNSVFDWFKHILNVYVLNGRELNEEESAALELSYTDFDENGEYVPVDVNDVIASWKTVFENFANMLNEGNNGASYIKDKNGKDIPLWMKLIRYTKSKKEWKAVNNGELAFPAFVGEGCIEKFVPNVLPSIRLNAIKEAIHPMNIEKPKTPNLGIAGGVGSAPAMGGVSFDANALNAEAFGGIAAEAAQDMPF